MRESTQSRVRLVIADDSLLIRQGVAALVEMVDDFELVAECVDLPTLETAVAELRPDAVVTDIRMPPTQTNEGVTAALRFRELYPEMGVIVLSQFSEPEFVTQLFADGSAGLGYLLKNRIGDVGEFTRAVRSVRAGESAVDSAIVDVLVSARNQRPSASDRLTNRESEVLGHIAEGLNNAAIAEKLVISQKAVAKHINSIFSKLDLSEEPDVHRRVKAVLLWLTG